MRRFVQIKGRESKLGTEPDRIEAEPKTRTTVDLIVETSTLIQTIEQLVSA
jgi:hypothetical protein